MKIPKPRTYTLKQIEDIAEANEFSLMTDDDEMEITLSAFEDSDPFGVFKPIPGGKFVFSLYLP